MKHCIKLVFANLLVLATGYTATTSASQVLFEANYTAEYSGIDIDIVRSLTAHEDGSYAYGLVADGGVATIKENSIFTIGETSLIPQDYYYRRKIMGFGGKETLKFDWKNKQATYYKNKKKKAVHPLNIPIYDPALYQLQMQLDLYAQKSPLQYHYMHKKKLRDREFKIIDVDKYELEGKTYDALVLKRVSQNPSKTTIIWVLPKLYFQIAYISQTDDGDTQETKLVSFSAQKEALAKFYTDATLRFSPEPHNPGLPATETTAAPLPAPM